MRNLGGVILSRGCGVASQLARAWRANGTRLDSVEIHRLTTGAGFGTYVAIRKEQASSRVSDPGSRIPVRVSVYNATL
jgi:hypothetical protein